MSIEYPSQQSNDPESTVDRLRTGFGSLVSSTITTLRVRFYSLRFGDWFSILLTLGVVAIAGTAFVGSTGALLAVASGLTLALTLVMTNSSNPLLSSLGVAVSMFAGVLAAAVGGFAVYILLQTGFSGLFAGLGIVSLVLASTGAFLAPIRSITRLAIARSTLVLAVGMVGVAGLVGVLVAPRAELRGLATEAGFATGQDSRLDAAVGRPCPRAVDVFLSARGRTVFDRSRRRPAPRRTTVACRPTVDGRRGD